MKITATTFEIFGRAVRLWSYESDVSLERVGHYGQDEILELAVNWSAVGAQNVEEALVFAGNVQIAAKIAEEINRYKFEVVYLREAMDEAEVAKVFNMITDQRIGKIGKWFESRRIE